MYLLVGQPVKQAMSNLQTQICGLEEDVGESETCQVGGSEGSIASYTLPAINVQLKAISTVSIGLPGGVVERRRGFLQGRHILDQVVDARGKLGI